MNSSAGRYAHLMTQKLFSSQWHGHKYNSSLSENQWSIATFIVIENEFIEFLTVSIIFTIFAALTLS
jgi:hypothetical protein